MFGFILFKKSFFWFPGTRISNFQKCVHFYCVSKQCPILFTCLKRVPLLLCLSKKCPSEMCLSKKCRGTKLGAQRDWWYKCSLFISGHWRWQGQVLRRQLSTPRWHRWRELPEHLRAGHLQGDGDVPALGRGPAVRRWLTHWRSPWLLQRHP